MSVPPGALGYSRYMQLACYMLALLFPRGKKGETTVAYSAEHTPTER